MNAPNKILLIVCLLISGVSFCQTDYNKPCLTIDLAMGNGVYGWTSMKIGTETPFFKHQKIEVRFGGGLDIGKKIGFGISISPYEFRLWDIKLNCDLTRVFGTNTEYIHYKEIFTIDNYTFDNTNLLIPSATIRLTGASFLTFNLTLGWAYGLTEPNIQHVSGLNLKRHQKNINNRLIGGGRFEFGLTIRLRKWKNSDNTIYSKSGIL